MPETAHEHDANNKRQSHREDQNPEVHFSRAGLPCVRRFKDVLSNTWISLWLHWTASIILMERNASVCDGFRHKHVIAGELAQTYRYFKILTGFSEALCRLQIDGHQLRHPSFAHRNAE